MNDKQKSRVSEEREWFDRFAREHGAELWPGYNLEAHDRRIERRAEVIAAKLVSVRNPKVLEIGCGLGWLSGYLLEKIPILELVAVDVSPQCVKVAAERYQEFRNARFETADAHHLTYAPASFDAIVGNSVLHHLEYQQVLTDCLRILRPGGAIIFFEPNLLNPVVCMIKKIKWLRKRMGESPQEGAFYRWQLAKFLRGIGFEDVCVNNFDFLLPMVPNRLIRVTEWLGACAERIPILREISGSLSIDARKPLDLSRG